jgi:hypothetical protein
MSIKVDNHGCQKKQIKYTILKYDYDYQKRKHPIIIYNHGSEVLKSINHLKKCQVFGGSFIKPNDSLKLYIYIPKYLDPTRIYENNERVTLWPCHLH